MDEKRVLNDRYQLEEILGSGGMAVVYRATDLMLERPVAVKILRQNFTDNEEFRERFRDEARSAANLSHPNIVMIHDFGISEGFPFMVMEFIPGQHLKRRIQLGGKLSINEAINLMAQTCAGVGYAHRAGLVHCDIKPHNLVVTPDSRLKVTDFGIARALATIHPGERAEIVWGSPQYFSPEQAAGDPPSPASDVYSLGVVMYEMLTGELPFKAESSEGYALQHQTIDPLPPRTINPEIPIELNKIVLKALSKEPSRRYRTADQLGRVLEVFPHEQAVSPVHSGKNQPDFQEPERFLSSSTLDPLSPAPREMELDREENPEQSVKIQEEFDWVTIFLGLLALIAVGGLIPFWLWVFFMFSTLP